MTVLTVAARLSVLVALLAIVVPAAAQPAYSLR